MAVPPKNKSFIELSERNLYKSFYDYVEQYFGEDVCNKMRQSKAISCCHSRKTQSIVVHPMSVGPSYHINNAIVLMETNDWTNKNILPWVAEDEEWKEAISIVNERLLNQKCEKLLALTKRHKAVMDEKGILISIYKNAGGFLWSMSKIELGTDLGYSEYSGEPERGGAFESYESALENALDLVAKCDLEQFQKECPADKFHWGNYAQWVMDNHK